MNSKPNNRTAALAGLWTSLGVLPFVAWSDKDAFSSGLVAWLVVAAIFIFLPAIYFVIGRDARRFGRNWINDPVERANYFALVTRILVWVATAVVSGMLLLLVHKYL